MFSVKTTLSFAITFISALLLVAVVYYSGPLADFDDINNSISANSELVQSNAFKCCKSDFSDGYSQIPTEPGCAYFRVSQYSPGSVKESKLLSLCSCEADKLIVIDKPLLEQFGLFENGYPSISVVSTGDDTSVVLYEEPGYKGFPRLVREDSTVDLRSAEAPEGGDWYGKTQSLILVTTRSGVCSKSLLSCPAKMTQSPVVSPTFAPFGLKKSANLRSPGNARTESEEKKYKWVKKNGKWIHYPLESSDVKATAKELPKYRWELENGKWHHYPLGTTYTFVPENPKENAVAVGKAANAKTKSVHKTLPVANMESKSLHAALPTKAKTQVKKAVAPVPSKPVEKSSAKPIKKTVPDKAAVPLKKAANKKAPSVTVATNPAVVPLKTSVTPVVKATTEKNSRSIWNWSFLNLWSYFQ